MKKKKKKKRQKRAWLLGKRSSFCDAEQLDKSKQMGSASDVSAQRVDGQGVCV
jgi:hypothetical protein